MTTRLPKAALSQYLRTRCDRMLACSINEQNPSVDTLLDLPARPGLAGFKARGNEFEREFLDKLETLYPAEFVDVPKIATGKIPRDLVFKAKPLFLFMHLLLQKMVEWPPDLDPTLGPYSPPTDL